MSSLSSLKELYPKINTMLGDIDIEIKDNYKKIKKELMVEVINEKIKFLQYICENEKLNFNEMQQKYLTDKEKKYVKININNTIVSDDNLLDIIEINDVKYYFENKESGNIYDNNSKIIGIYKNKTHQLF
jgi:hypothetical protein